MFVQKQDIERLNIVIQSLTNLRDDMEGRFANSQKESEMIASARKTLRKAEGLKNRMQDELESYYA